MQAKSFGTDMTPIVCLTVNASLIYLAVESYLVVESEVQIAEAYLCHADKVIWH